MFEQKSVFQKIYSSLNTIIIYFVKINDKNCINFPTLPLKRANKNQAQNV